MITFRPANARDTARILEIWRKAVDATHDFLHRADRAAIEEEVTAFLPEAALMLAVDASDKPLGFKPTGRSDLDGQGRPYPLVHLGFRATEQ